MAMTPISSTCSYGRAGAHRAFDALNALPPAELTAQQRQQRSELKGELFRYHYAAVPCGWSSPPSFVPAAPMPTYEQIGWERARLGLSEPLVIITNDVSS